MFSNFFNYIFFPFLDLRCNVDLQWRPGTSALQHAHAHAEAMAGATAGLRIPGGLNKS